MSTIKVDNLQTTGGAGLYPAKAWATWSAVPTSLQASGNVSSLSDLGTGYFSVNFSSNLSTSNYTFVSGSVIATDGTVGSIGSDMGYDTQIANKTTSFMRHRTSRASQPSYVDFYANQTAYAE